MTRSLLAVIILFLGELSLADIIVKKISEDLPTRFREEKIWQNVDPEQSFDMMSQPMVPPMPKQIETAHIGVTAIHDGKWIVFRLRWKDSEPSEADKLATFSDAVALQFPIKNNEEPPPVMMGNKGDPVHLFHWRYQYQLDAELGKKSIEKIYPNMTVDMYPMDFKMKGNFREFSGAQKESFVGGTAAGNPQSFPKSGVDEIFAEGFGTSAVSESHQAKGFGQWKSGEWTVFIARPLQYKDGSKLIVGKKSHVAFAVWQGGKKEVGALKSLTMVWTPIVLKEN